MTEKLLVLCCEQYTIDKDGDFIDENNNKIMKVGKDKFINVKWEKVDVNEDRKIINAMDLIYPTIQKSIEEDKVILADWKSIIPINDNRLIEIEEYSKNNSQVPLDFLFDIGYNTSIKEKIYINTLMNENRPIKDFYYKANENFIKQFIEGLKRNNINSILPAFSKNDLPEIAIKRENFLKRIGRNNENISNILPCFYYTGFNELKEKIDNYKKSYVSRTDDNNTR